MITPEDLGRARPRIEPADIVIMNTSWNQQYGDDNTYFAYSPGLYKEERGR